MSSHSKKPRNYHDYENQVIGNNYQKLSCIRDIVTSIMDDLYEARELPVESLGLCSDRKFKQREFTEEEKSLN